MNISESNTTIIQYLAAGKVYKEIAAAMGIKVRTIRERIRVLKLKYSCTTIAQLVVKYQEKQSDMSH